MKFFGKGWAMADNLGTIDTPVGEKCFGCRKAITWDDLGVAMPFEFDEGEREVYYHRKCILAALDLKEPKS